MPATLRSNCGRDEFIVKCVTPVEYANDLGFESCVYLRGHHWDDGHTFPLSMSFDGLWLRSADLMALYEHIERWINQPLDRLHVDDLSGDFELARLPGQSVRIDFGPRPDTISGLNPVVSITLSAGKLHSEFHFTTDQSCLTIFAQELSAELRVLH